MFPTDHARTTGELAFLARLVGAVLPRMTCPDASDGEGDESDAFDLASVLLEDELDESERHVVRTWGDRERTRVVDRLAERRIERALADALEFDAARRGRPAPEEHPRVILLRAIAGDLDASDLSDLEPGAPLEALVDALVLARGEAMATRADRIEGLAAFRVEMQGARFDLLAEAGEDAARLTAEIHELQARLSRAIGRANANAVEERLEERDLSGMLLGGKYRVKRLKGKGGFGNVYEAVDEGLGARVAIKVLNRRAEGSPSAVEHFLREAKLLTTVDHENIVRWITFDRTDDGLHYFVMEYLGGEELEELLQREGRLAPEHAARIILRVLSALRAAHRLEGGALLHLDLKPENVFVLPAIGPEDAERIKVIDFGIGQHVGASARGGGTPPPGEASSVFDEDPARSISATVSHEIDGFDRTNDVQRVRGGTLLYASPEQCAHLAGHRDIVSLDGRSDLYSLGIMAFRMLTGEFPFERCATATDAIRNHLEVPPRKVREVSKRVPRRLAAFVDRCLAKNRDQRFQDPVVAYDELSRIVHPPARWTRVAAAGLLATSALLFGLWPEARLEPFDVSTPVVVLGPTQPSRVLSVTNLHSGAAAGRLEFVKDPQTDEPALAGWTGEVVANGGRFDIALAAPAGLRATRDERVYIRLEGDGRLQYSAPIDIRFLGDAAWDVTGVQLPDLDGRALDPAGQVLAIQIEGRETDIASVSVTWRETNTGRAKTEPRAATLDESRSRSRELHYVLPLDSFGAVPPGLFEPARFEVEVVDRAGGTKPPTALEVQLDTRELTIEANLTGSLRERPDEYLVFPDDRPVLEVTTNRDAEVDFVAFDDDGIPIDLVRERLANGRTQLEFPPADAPYGGRIVISATDEARVSHDDPRRGTRTLTLRFAYRTTKPKVTVSPVGLVAAGTSTDAPVYYTNDDELVLDLERNEVQVWVEVTCRGDATGSLLKRDVALHLSPSKQVELPLPEDGSYRVSVDAFRYSGVNTTKPESPEFSYDLELVRDTAPPRVTLDGPAEAVVGGSNELAFALVVERPHAGRAAPLALRAMLFRDGAESPTWTGAELETALDATGHGRLTALSLGFPRLSDGAYELRVEGEDAAGNLARVEDASARFEVAGEGPALTLQTPLGDEWTPLSGNRFRVVVLAVDANDVAGVSSSVRDAAGGDVGPNELRISDDADPTKAEWSGTFELPASWSGQRVVIEYGARDARGNVTEPVPHAVELGAFEVVRPARVAVELTSAPGVEIGTMRLLERDPSYRFGGRSPREENRAFAEYGLSYDGRSRIEDVRSVLEFYLDEDEVTVAQYRAFLEAPGGYRDPARWMEREPSETRRVELLRELMAMDANLPVTALDWHEADAYARWVGKRLPTLVEWEYAVRGGFAYRPFSCAVEAARFDASALNVDTGFEGGRTAWPVDEGEDVTPTGIGSGIRNLCSNVSEWTATPRSPSTYFAAGASFEHLGAFDFSIAFAYPADTRKNRIGFRCALSCADVDDASEAGSATRVRVRAIRPEGEARSHEDH